LLSVALVVGCDTPQALPGTLPYGARTFLPSARLPPKEDDDEAATVWSASARSI